MDVRVAKPQDRDYSVIESAFLASGEYPQLKSTEGVLTAV